MRVPPIDSRAKREHPTPFRHAPTAMPPCAALDARTKLYTPQPTLRFMHSQNNRAERFVSSERTLIMLRHCSSDVKANSVFVDRTQHFPSLSHRLVSYPSIPKAFRDAAVALGVASIAARLDGQGPTHWPPTES